MKYFSFLALLFVSSMLSAQSNCGNTLPIQNCPLDTVMCLFDTTDEPIITTSSNLPTLEFAVTDNDRPAPTGNGNIAVGIDTSGIFVPADLGLMAGGSFDLNPVAYDRPAVQGILDNILTGQVPILPPFVFISCCDAIQQVAGISICDTLNAYGINSGSDFMSLQQLSALGGSNDSLSLTDFLLLIDTVNMQLADAPSQCGGGQMICYAVGNACTMQIYSDTVSILLPHPSDELVEASSTILSSGIVNSPDSVIYRAQMCIELQDGFEVNVGAKFLAETEGVCE